MLVGILKRLNNKQKYFVYAKKRGKVLLVQVNLVIRGFVIPGGLCCELFWQTYPFRENTRQKKKKTVISRYPLS